MDLKDKAKKTALQEIMAKAQKAFLPENIINKNLQKGIAGKDRMKMINEITGAQPSEEELKKLKKSKLDY